jgi:hypothetical protein
LSAIAAGRLLMKKLLLAGVAVRFIAAGSLFLCAVVAGLLITTYSYAQVRPEELRRDKFHPHTLPHREEQPPQSREQREAERILRCKLGIGSFWDKCRSRHTRTLGQFSSVSRRRRDKNISSPHSHPEDLTRVLSRCGRPLGSHLRHLRNSRNQKLLDVESSASSA